jgi:hypothetical protein
MGTCTLEEELHSIVSTWHQTRLSYGLTSYSSFAIVAVGGEEGVQLGDSLER